MTKEAIINCIRTNGNRTYVVTTSDGKETKMRLFISMDGKVCEFAKRSRTRGFSFSDAVLAEWVSLRLPVSDRRETSTKYIKYAKKATFISDFVNRCLMADPDKSPYENNLSTGCAVDNEVITLNAVAKYAPYEVEKFRQALAERKSYQSGRFNFRGYDGSLWIEVYDNGEIRAGFSKEYRGCGNGYYYALVNDDTFIGVDVD